MQPSLEESIENYLVFALSKDGIILSNNDRMNVTLSVKKNKLKGQELSKFVSRKHYFEFHEFLPELEKNGFWRGDIWLYNHKKKYHLKINLNITLKDNLLHCIGLPVKNNKENKEIVKKLYKYLNKYEQ